MAERLDALRSTDATPVAQLHPGIEDSESQAVDGVVTVTWPHSVVTRSIAFVVAEHDYLLRRPKGQLRVEFHGPASKAVAKARIGGGDKVLISLGGASWESSLVSAQLLAGSLEWQLKFSTRLLMIVRRTQDEGSEVIDVDEPDIVEPQSQQHAPAVDITVSALPASPTRQSEAVPAAKSPPAFAAGSTPPQAKRRASLALGLEEYALPAFIKRARVSYGSLFEDGLDIFNEKEKGNKRTRRRARFSMHGTHWRYSSRSPSPTADISSALEGDIRDDSGKDSDVEAVKNGSDSLPQKPKMVDEACQTQQEYFDLSPVNIDPAAETRLTGAAEQLVSVAPAPPGALYESYHEDPPTPSRTLFERQSSDHVTSGVARQPQMMCEEAEPHNHHGFEFALEPPNSPKSVLRASAIAASSVDNITHDEGIAPRAHPPTSSGSNHHLNPTTLQVDPHLQFLTETHALSSTFCGTPPPESIPWQPEPVPAERSCLASATYDSPPRRRSPDTDAEPDRRSEYVRNTLIALGDAPRKLCRSEVADRNDADHGHWDETGVLSKNGDARTNNHARDDDENRSREDDLVSESGEAEQRRITDYLGDVEEDEHQVQAWEATRDGKTSEKSGSTSDDNGSSESSSEVEDGSYYSSQGHPQQAESFDGEEQEYTYEGQDESGQDAFSHDDNSSNPSPGRGAIQEPVVISLLSDSEDEGESPHEQTTPNSPLAEVRSTRSAQGRDDQVLAPPSESSDSKHVSEPRTSVDSCDKKDEASYLDAHRDEDQEPAREDVSMPSQSESIELAKNSPQARSSAAHSQQESLNAEDEGSSHEHGQSEHADDSTDRHVVLAASEPTSLNPMDVDQEEDGELGGSSPVVEVTTFQADDESSVPHKAQGQSLIPCHSQQQALEDKVLAKTKTAQTDAVDKNNQRLPTPSNNQARRKARWSPQTESNSPEEDKDDDLASEAQVLAEYETCRLPTKSIATAMDATGNRSKGNRSSSASPETGRGQQIQGEHREVEVPLSVDTRGSRTPERLRYSDETDDECAGDPSLALATTTCVCKANADDETGSDPSLTLATATSVCKADADDETDSERIKDPSLALARATSTQKPLGKALDGDGEPDASITTSPSRINTRIKRSGTSSENARNASLASARATSTSKSPEPSDTEKPLNKDQEPAAPAIPYSLRSLSHRRSKSNETGSESILDVSPTLDKAGSSCQLPGSEAEKARDGDQEPEAPVAPYLLRSRTHQRTRLDASSEGLKDPGLALVRLGSACKSSGLESEKALNEVQMADALSAPYSLRGQRHKRTRSGETEHSERDDESSPGLAPTASDAIAEGEANGMVKQSLYVVFSQSHDSDASVGVDTTSTADVKGDGRQTTPCTKEANATKSWIDASPTTSPTTSRSRQQQVSPETRQEMQTRAQETARKTTPDTIAESGMLTSSSIGGSVAEDDGVIALKRALLRTLREGLADFIPLRNLQSSLNKVTDVLGISTCSSRRPYRPKHGPRDYMLELIVTDPSIAPVNVVVAHLFRPYQTSLPAVQAGDVILLRRMHIVSVQGRGFGVRAGDLSAWAVFKKDNEEMLPQIKGPPVEVTEDEAKYAQGLKRWWAMQDEKALAKMQKATTAKVS